MTPAMPPRRPDEEHRAATPLELFFDLVFVVAIATAAGDLHHGIAERHVFSALVGYGAAFFGTWWAWVNFTWFASAYDPDDVPYRLLVFVQMTGALIFAAGVSSLAHGDLLVATVGYVVMRIALVAQWLRAASNDPKRRTTALRYAMGVFTVQLGWVALLFAPERAVPVGFVTLAAVELAIPAWAEAEHPTSWHPHHIAERYGLFTIIVLGESVLSATGSIQSVLLGDAWEAGLIPTIAGGLLILYSMWWIYFEDDCGRLLTSNRRAFVWGYTHYLVFGAAAAVGAGLSVVTDAFTGHAELTARAAAWAVAIPVAIYVACLWALMDRGHGKRFAKAPGALVALLALLTPFAPSPILMLGLLLAAYVAMKSVVKRAAVALG